MIEYYANAQGQNVQIIDIVEKQIQELSKSFPICRTISCYIDAYTLINHSFEFHFYENCAKYIVQT